MTINLTEAAAEEVKNSKEEGHYLRVAVQGGGCSGFEYKLTFDLEYDEGKDTLSNQHGVDIIVDRKSDLYLDGTVLDYYSDISKRGFTFENPNAVKSCGCGSSFQA
jgi:iron-sulfur cluster assembly accessory protein